MRRFVYLQAILLSFFSTGLQAQNQLEIARVAQMADFPSPYMMRDWRKVALQYDSLVFRTDLEGEYLPIVSLSDESVNYPGVGTILMDSYVGGSGSAGESINIIPAIVGATLVGVDKSNHYATDWVERVKNFYNLKNGELVYLNGTSESSGNDWWYETMPNVFFYQLYTQYPDIPEFQEQFRTIADRWLTAVQHMGASTTPWAVPQMNYRAWNLTSMEPLASGVKEPESAGAIAWLLYQAYQRLGDTKYLIGAQQAMDFLSTYSGNPSYELQLPYGVLTAARMNAELGTQYDIQKMINWCFSRGELRGWGSIVGTWDGKDVSGLIGEANDNGDDYAFMMNGFQQAAALVPLVKYDKRYASAIGKWVLNMANASRLFYSGYVDPGHQSDYSWSQANDPHSVIAYEAIKEKWEGTSLFARGDAKDAGWAQTNLGLYGSSHVGYLGAIVKATDVEGILQLDVNATDFYGSHVFPTYLLYNPFDSEKLVTIDVGSTPVDVYEAISETFIKSSVSGEVVIALGAKSSRLVAYVPAGSQALVRQKKLWIGSDVVDYHYGYDFTGSLRIKSLSPTFDLGEVNLENVLYCTVVSETNPTFMWYIDDVLQEGDTASFSWIPQEVGSFKIKVNVTLGAETVADSLQLEVVELIPQKPVLDTLYASNLWVFPDSVFWVNATVHDPRGLDLSVEWSVENGMILEQTDSEAKIQASTAGICSITFTASNYAEQAQGTLRVLVTENTTDSDPLVYLPLDGISTDQSGNQFETHLQGGDFTMDPLGNQGRAIYIGSPSDELIVSNTPAINFEDAISISLWAYFTDFNEERFLISHGSWDQRWKVSTTTDRKLRWTVNTTDGIRDLDATPTLQKNTWYHLTAVYSGASLQLYLNGQLNSFVAHTGQINESNVDLCIGKRLPGDTQYYLKGRVDEVKIYDLALGPDEIGELSTKWWEAPVLGISDSHGAFYPNPVSTNTLYLQTTDPGEVIIRDIAGNQVAQLHVIQLSDALFQVDIPDFSQGIYLLTFNSTSHKLIIR